MQAFSAGQGRRIIGNLADSVIAAKQHLSEIDGAIGDGDHGINMGKGFELTKGEIAGSSGNLSDGLGLVSTVLMTKIGGAMGPLYGMIFRAMSAACRGKESIDAEVFGNMLTASQEAIARISQAKVGDKTLLDALAPASLAFRDRVSAGGSFLEALGDMKKAAAEGRDATKDMVAKIGRASRLGERSRGVPDAGATSCCLILTSLADSIAGLLCAQVTDSDK